MTNLTLAIIKPDSYEKGNDQLIAARFIQEGFKPIAMKYKYLSPNEAKQFYAIHKDKPFFKDLIDFMTSGPIIVYALEREDAVKKFRNLIGDTDPTKAEPGSIRSIYGTDIAHNAIHGSDSNENAATEILFFFPELQTKVLENKK